MENLMFSKKSGTQLIIILALGLLFVAAACSGGTAPVAVTPADAAPADSGETAVVDPVVAADTAESGGEASANQPPVTQPETITQSGDAVSAAEIAGLLFMREEEKLARDVYTAMYELWGMNIFNNIAASEQMHIDAVLNLLAVHNIPDPAADNETGQFTNQALQSLYDELIATGSQSLDAALTVGAAIEEIDILDLDERINGTANADIIAVYENLRSGSENHLRSFVSTYERQTGTAYQPQYLDQTAYEMILSNTTAQGRGHGENEAGQGNGSNGQGNQGSGGNGQGNGNQGNGNQGTGNGNNGQGNNGGGNGKGRNGS
jgi:hypothetical protein